MAMNRKNMLDYIQDRLSDASDADVEAVYWMIIMELDG